MTDGKVASLNMQHKTIRAPGHDQVLFSMKMKAGQGILRSGLIVAIDGDDEGIPFDIVSVSLGTGTGSTKNFSGTLTGGVCEPGSVTVTDGTETFVDDGLGNLIGSAGGTGSVVYRSGAVSVSFDAAVTNGTDVAAVAGKEIAGVLDRDVDTGKPDPGLVIVHGTVKEAELVKGTGAACGTAEFKLLRRRTIYPV